MAGLFCGSSGYLCAIASGTNDDEGSGDEGSGEERMNMPRSLDEDFSKYPQLNLDHYEYDE